jgi:hypothetical protein
MTAWFLLGLEGAQRSAMAANEMSQDQFDQRMHDYILAHPEVVMQALQSLDARQREADAAAAKAVLASRADDIFRDKQSRRQCASQGHHGRVLRLQLPLLPPGGANHGASRVDDPQLKIVYKEFPILGPDSVFAAKAALAAEKQGKYTAFHKALFDAKTRVTEAIVLKIAAEAGLGRRTA